MAVLRRDNLILLEAENKRGKEQKLGPLSKQNSAFEENTQDLPTGLKIE